jgi:hypothetical protein
LTDSLLGELIENGLEIVDKQRLLTTFAPLIRASKDSLDEELERYRTLVSARWGENADRAFRSVGDIEVPLLLEGLYAQRAQETEKENVRLAERASSAEARAKVADKDKADLSRLRSKASEKHQKAVRKQRAAKSRPGKKRRRGK